MDKAENFSDTDLCVKCGLCLPHCPTYVKTRDENESPRGRLALVQAWSKGDLPITPKLQDHIDNCLLCRACERVCPARVPYGRLLDDFRAEPEGGKPQAPLGARLKLNLVRSMVGDKSRLQRGRRWLTSAKNLLASKPLRYSGLAKLAPLRELAAMTSELTAHPGWQDYYPANGKQRGEVGLFVGCMGTLMDTATVDAAIFVLTRLGFGVAVPTSQACCGALALHSGDVAGAQSLAGKNLAAFDTAKLDAIISIASGCGATLQEYPQHCGEKSSAFADKIIDISAFLVQQNWPGELRPEALEAVVCIHTPCSLKNVMRQDSAAIQLLNRIPGLQAKPLPSATLCCGSAGSYMLDHPAMAKSLRADVLAAATALRPDYLVTSNIGCSLHLMAGLKAQGSALKPMHPVRLLARQLGGSC